MVSMNDPTVYLSVQRWLKKLRLKGRKNASEFYTCETKKAALFWLKKYINFIKSRNKKISENRHMSIDPDSIILNRKSTLANPDELIQRSHEDCVEDFELYLQDKKYASNTVSTAIGMIRSFYKSNSKRYSIDDIIISPSSPERIFKVPSKKELKKMCKHADPEIKTFMLCEKDCGLRMEDLRTLTFDRRSTEYGTIEQQLKKGVVPIHIVYDRKGTGKTGARMSTFFGPNAIEAIKENIPITKSGRIFKACKSSIQQRIKATAIKARVGTKTIPVTSHRLRTFFSSKLKSDEMQDDMVEYMMGHSIGVVKSAYFASTPSELANIYMKHYSALDLNVTKSSPRESTLDILKKYLPPEVYATVTQDL